MRFSTSGLAISRSLMQSALTITVAVLCAAIILLPFAIGQAGSGGPLGLAAATAICLTSALLSEFIAGLLYSLGSPLAALLVGMAVRIIPILSACLVFAALGFRGREHLSLIGYFLAFYFVTLVIETCLAVMRVAGRQSAHAPRPIGGIHG